MITDIEVVTYEGRVVYMVLRPLLADNWFLFFFIYDFIDIFKHALIEQNKYNFFASF